VQCEQLEAFFVMAGSTPGEEDHSKDKPRAATDAKGAEATRQRQRSRSRERSDRDTRLKPPPPKAPVKTSAASPSSKAGSADSSTGAAAGSSKPSTKVLADDVLTRVAQEKWEAQEDKLKDLAKGCMTFLRDYPKMSPQTCNNKVVELTKTGFKYVQQFIRVIELQEKTRKRECKVLDEEIERLRKETEKEIENAKDLMVVVEREKKRGQRHLDMDRIASEINQLPTRVELQEQIAKEEAEIAANRKMFAEIKALNEHKDQKVQMLLHLVTDLKQDLHTLREKESTFGGVLGSEAAASSSASGEERDRGRKQKDAVQVIS